MAKEDEVAFGITRDNEAVFKDPLLEAFGIEKPSERLEPKFFDPGDKLFMSGDSIETVPYILSGRFILTDESDRITDVVGPREIVSWDFLKEKLYSSNAVAIEPSNLVAIPRDQFFKLMKANEAVRRYIHALLDHTTARAEQHLYIFKSGNVKERGANALLEFSDQEGFVYVTQDTLAQRAGVSREQLNKDSISSLKRRGILITIRGTGGTLINNRSALSSITRNFSNAPVNKSRK